MQARKYLGAPADLSDGVGHGGFRTTIRAWAAEKAKGMAESDVMALPRSGESQRGLTIERRTSAQSPVVSLLCAALNKRRRISADSPRFAPPEQRAALDQLASRIIAAAEAGERVSSSEDPGARSHNDR